MSFRFQKRIKLGKGLGVNIGKSGITTSYRTKRGSISSKGYSFRTGIPGITYRKTFSKAKNSGCFLVIIFFMLTFLTTAICCKNKKTHANASNQNIIANLEGQPVNYRIIKEEKNYVFKKTNIEIRLEKEIDIKQLHDVASKLKRERPALEKLWVFYYLPKNNTNNGAWATTHFSPDLEVKILGASKESSKELDIKTVSGEVLGVWKDNDAMIPNRVFLVKENNMLYMKTLYAKSSLTEAGELVEKVFKSKDSNSRVIYNYDNVHGEYYAIENNGNLGLYDNSGKFKEAKKRKLETMEL